MKEKLLTLIVFCAVHFGLSGQSQSNYYYNRDIQNPPASETWPGEGKQFTSVSDVMIYVPPDAWILELHGTEDATTLETARARLQTRITAFQKKLNAMGIPNEDITITTYSQEKNSGWKFTPEQGSVYGVIGYTLTKSILIRYKDPKQYSQIITAAGDQSLDNVQQHYCTVADEQAVYAELYRQAMDVCLQKQAETAEHQRAIITPAWNVAEEYYDVQTPTPGAYVAPGTVPVPQNSGYDRVLSSEYGNGAVKYTIHLEITYTLTKPQPNPNSPVKTK
jgi:uncharacterized protein YggE